jgi:hypothetical protein
MKLERDLRLFPALVAVFAFLLIAALLPLGPARVLLFTGLSGFAPLACVRRRWHWLELLVTPPAASLLLFAFAGAGLGPRSALVGFVPALLCLSLALWARRADRRITLVLGWPDAAAALALAIWIWPVVSVFRRNGLHLAGYLARNWFGRDSFYLFSIAEEAVQRNGWPVENPFLAGVGNYYPSLLHVGLGTLAAQSTAPTPVGILWPVPLLLVASPVLCLLAALRDSGRASLLRGIVVLVGLGGAVGLRPDLFVYPHTQALAMGWLFSCVGSGVSARRPPSAWPLFVLAVLSCSRTA